MHLEMSLMQNKFVSRSVVAEMYIVVILGLEVM